MHIDIAIIDDPVRRKRRVNNLSAASCMGLRYNTVLSTSAQRFKAAFIMTHGTKMTLQNIKSRRRDWTVLSIPAICEQEHDEHCIHHGISVMHFGRVRHSKRKLSKGTCAREFSALYQQHRHREAVTSRQA